MPAFSPYSSPNLSNTDLVAEGSSPLGEEGQNTPAAIAKELGKMLISENQTPDRVFQTLGNLQRLPAELLIHIFSFLEAADRGSVRLLNRYAQSLVGESFQISSADELKTLLSGNSKIESLTLMSPFFTDDDIRLIPNPPKYLDASHCPLLTDNVFKHWETPPQHLNVNGCRQLADGAFAHWETAPTFLSVSHCKNLTIAAFAHWRTLPEQIFSDDCPGLINIHNRENI